MNEFWNYKLFNNTIEDITIALGIILLSLLAIQLVHKVLIRRLKTAATRTKTTFDDFILTLLQSAAIPLLSIIAFYFGLQYLTLPAKAATVLHIGVLVVITFYLLRIITSFIGYIFRRSLLKNEQNTQRVKQSRGILLIVQVAVWFIGALFLIDNLGYDITTLVAGLGIGGIAIALAAQTILGDLFSYLVIFFDKPFEIGDFIIVDDKLGTIEYIGIKTTRIRTLSGEQLICSNTDLTNSRVHNYKRMQERRVLFTFRVVYTTPAEKLKLIPQYVQQIITEQKDTRFDRAHFKSFSDYSLEFEVVFYVLSADYNIYMDIQQAINLRIFELFEKEKIEFALPTRILQMNPSSIAKDRIA